MELIKLDGNDGNKVRASSGKITERASVPIIFKCGTPISKLNDGTLGFRRKWKIGCDVEHRKDGHNKYNVWASNL